MKEVVLKQLRKNETLVYLYARTKDFYYKHLISDLNLIRNMFKKNVGREVELANPSKYNDKLQWLKLNWYDKRANICVDKYDVRSFVKEKVGEKYLNELYSVYDSVDEIDLDQLPNSFVLKGTHGSGFNIICRNKSDINLKRECKKIARWLKRNYYWQNREWVYKELKPRMISEKFLIDEQGNPPMDYKIFCFHGEPKLIQVDIDRFGGHKQNFYDTEWNFRDVEIWCDNDKSVELSKPENFDEMLEISRKLSESFPHVRVDLYNIDGEIIFGELTFFHLSGIQKFRNESLEDEMGSWLDLERINKNGEYVG
jgi:hypothetical protein